MKKVMFSGLLMLTIGMVSAKDIQSVSSENSITLDTHKIEYVNVSYEDAEIINSDGSSACKWAGRAARIMARLLGADKEEAKEIGNMVEEFCNEIT